MDRHDRDRDDRAAPRGDIHNHVHHHQHDHVHNESGGGTGDNSAVLSALAAINEKLDALKVQGEQLIMARQEDHALLDQINTYTNKLAAQQEADAAKTQEISDDLDALIAELKDTTVKARLQKAADDLAIIASKDEARAATLLALAAKHEQPLPPPVEPEPVEPTPPA